jgi:plastocyanin
MRKGLASTLACLALLGASGLVTAQQAASVSQRNRAFSPREVTVPRGGSIVFVNDDGDLLHHVHSLSTGATFDIGEQAAGTSVPVRFANAGMFEVRCGIHPRMLLRVTVQ